MNTLTTEQIKSIWDLAIKSYQEPQLEPGEKTKKMIIDDYGLSEQQVESMVRRLILSGKMKRRAIVCRGHKTYAYSVIVEE